MIRLPVEMHDAIEKEIRIAETIFGAHQKDLCSHPVLINQLERYRTSIDRTTLVMKEIGMVNGCAECAQRTGSCCFREVEEGYDHVMLLVNLLMGIPLPQKREISGNCYFLGKRGCKLMARDSFCINYICTDLKRALGPSTVSDFSAIADEEIFRGWQIELTIRQWLDSQIGSSGK